MTELLRRAAALVSGDARSHAATLVPGEARSYASGAPAAEAVGLTRRKRVNTDD